MAGVEGVVAIVEAGPPLALNITLPSLASTFPLGTAIPLYWSAALQTLLLNPDLSPYDGSPGQGDGTGICLAQEAVAWAGTEVAFDVTTSPTPTLQLPLFLGNATVLHRLP